MEYGAMVPVSRAFLVDAFEPLDALRGVFRHKAEQDGYEITGEPRLTILDPKDPEQSVEYMLPEEFQSPEGMVYAKIVAECIELERR